MYIDLVQIVGTMADEKPKELVGELQQEITGFEKSKLKETKTEAKIYLPDAATIEAEKKAAKEAAAAQ